MKTVGIIGGMGPLATADLFRKTVMNTKASCDPSAGGRSGDADDTLQHGPRVL